MMTAMVEDCDKSWWAMIEGRDLTRVGEDWGEGPHHDGWWLKGGTLPGWVMIEGRHRTIVQWWLRGILPWRHGDWWEGPNNVMIEEWYLTMAGHDWGKGPYHGGWWLRGGTLPSWLMIEGRDLTVMIEERSLTMVGDNWGEEPYHGGWWLKRVTLPWWVMIKGRDLIMVIDDWGEGPYHGGWWLRGWTLPWWVMIEEGDLTMVGHD